MLTQQFAGFPVGFRTRNRVQLPGTLGTGTHGVPQIVIIDRKGVIREQSTAQEADRWGYHPPSSVDREPAGRGCTGEGSGQGRDSKKAG